MGPGVPFQLVCAGYNYTLPLIQRSEEKAHSVDRDATLWRRTHRGSLRTQDGGQRALLLLAIACQRRKRHVTILSLSSPLSLYSRLSPGTSISASRRRPTSWNARGYASLGPSFASDTHRWLLQWRCATTTTFDLCESAPADVPSNLPLTPALPSGTNRQLRLRRPSNRPTQISTIETNPGIVRLFLSGPSSADG